MDDRIFSLLERVESKVDRLDGRLDSMDRTVERLTTTVEVHEKRSTTLETRQELCETTCARQMDILRDTVVDITASLKTVRNTVMLVVGGVGFVAAIAQIFSVWMEVKK